MRTTDIDNARLIRQARDLERELRKMYQTKKTYLIALEDLYIKRSRAAARKHRYQYNPEIWAIKQQIYLINVAIGEGQSTMTRARGTLARRLDLSDIEVRRLIE